MTVTHGSTNTDEGHSPAAGLAPAAQKPIDVLRSWYSTQTLAVRFPEVPGLMADMVADKNGAADLIRAGRLLERLDAAEVCARHPGTEVIKVAITGHSTVGEVTVSLRAELARHGMLLEARSGDFDSYLRELEDTSGHLYASGTRMVLCILDPGIIFDELPAPWTVQDLTQAISAKLTHLTRLAGNYVQAGPAALVFNTVPLPANRVRELVDHSSRARLGIAWREFNIGLLKLAAQHAKIHVIDLEPQLGAKIPLSEPRMATYAKANLSAELLAAYAREIAHLSRALRGRAKKVLVLDADNTMWDGVLGDDGPDGIAAAGTLRGEAFGEFQRVVKQLASQGVLLAVSSKNDQEPVESVLRTHPDMILRYDDFVAINANWNPKDGNLVDIATRLNLNVDSFVFADDSPFECGLVASSLPGVAVVRLDDEPALHAHRLLADGWFDVPEVTEADHARAASYRTDAARSCLLAESGSTADYLRQLGVVVTLSKVKDQDIARVTQLTLRTNQFNLTTERLQAADVTARAADSGHIVLTIRVSDRFGDSGLVGAVFARVLETGMEVENMLLSCRVFARGVEQAAIAGLMSYAAASGLGPVWASYRPSAKNGRVRDFYPSLGFVTADSSDTSIRFRHDLAEAELPAVPDHVRLDSELEPVLEGTSS